MFKKITISFVFVSLTEFVYSAGPSFMGAGLPWATGWNARTPLEFLISVVSEAMLFVAVAWVFALIFSWVMYLISAWEDEKATKARKWIIYSLVWVFVSSSAWWIINLINNLRIG